MKTQTVQTNLDLSVAFAKMATLEMATSAMVNNFVCGFILRAIFLHNIYRY